MKIAMPKKTDEPIVRVEVLLTQQERDEIMRSAAADGFSHLSTYMRVLVLREVRS